MCCASKRHRRHTHLPPLTEVTSEGILEIVDLYFWLPRNPMLYFLGNNYVVSQSFLKSSSSHCQAMNCMNCQRWLHGFRSGLILRAVGGGEGISSDRLGKVSWKKFYCVQKAKLVTFLSINNTSGWGNYFPQRK